MHKGAVQGSEAGAGRAVPVGRQIKGRGWVQVIKASLPCDPLQIPGFGTGAENNEYPGEDRHSALLGGLGCWYTIAFKKKSQQPFLLCWLQWPEMLVSVCLRNIPVQITKGHSEKGVSIIPKATGDSLVRGERLRGRSGLAQWAEGQEGGGGVSHSIFGENTE